MQMYLKLGSHSSGQKFIIPLFDIASLTYACSWRNDDFIFCIFSIKSSYKNFSFPASKR